MRFSLTSPTVYPLFRRRLYETVGRHADDLLRVHCVFLFINRKISLQWTLTATELFRSSCRDAAATSSAHSMAIFQVVSGIRNVPIDVLSLESLDPLARLSFIDGDGNHVNGM